MKKLIQSNFLIALIGWATVCFSVEAIIYYTRWFVPVLAGHHSFVAPPIKIPQLWFIAKIASNGIFLWVGILLLGLFKQYKRNGYFDKDSLRVLDKVILACVSLALLGFIRTLAENLDELHTKYWTSPWGMANSLYRFFTRMLVLKDPQTMYLLLAAILCGVRQFVVQALSVKKENDLFI